jgi:hypothetical protein
LEIGNKSVIIFQIEQIAKEKRRKEGPREERRAEEKTYKLRVM